MDTTDYIEQIRKLQAELDIVTRECNDWKEKFERLLTYQKQPRCSPKDYPKGFTTVGWNEGEDWK